MDLFSVSKFSWCLFNFAGLDAKPLVLFFFFGRHPKKFASNGVGIPIDVFPHGPIRTSVWIAISIFAWVSDLFVCCNSYWFFLGARAREKERLFTYILQKRKMDRGKKKRKRVGVLCLSPNSLFLISPPRSSLPPPQKSLIKPFPFPCRARLLVSKSPWSLELGEEEEEKEEEGEGGVFEVWGLGWMDGWGCVLACLLV